MKVELDLPADPMLVRGDPGELEDLVGNLVSNAIKYSDPGDSVTVSVQRVVQGGTAYVELAVIDEGIGIAEEEQGRLFEEFFRSENVAARSSARHRVGAAGGRPGGAPAPRPDRGRVRAGRGHHLPGAAPCTVVTTRPRPGERR